MASTSSTATHQWLLLAGALVLAAGLYILPKGIVKPKESRTELRQDAAATATRDGGGVNTNGSKADASSGPRPAETGTVAGTAAGMASAAPHTQATAAQRQELNTLLAQFRAAPNAAAQRQVVKTLAARYSAVERFDSAGYYLATVAAAQPSERAWQQAADAYFQAYSFAASAERKKLLGDEARELYDKVLAINPNNLDSKTNLGMAYMSSDNPVKGIGLLREVLETDPKNQKVLYNLGILAIQSGQYDRAAERLGELVALNPKSVEGQFYLGVSLARLRRAAAAEAAFNKAKSLSNDPALAASIQEELAKLQR